MQDFKQQSLGRSGGMPRCPLPTNFIILFEVDSKVIMDIFISKSVLVTVLLLGHFKSGLKV